MTILSAWVIPAVVAVVLLRSRAFVSRVVLLVLLVVTSAPAVFLTWRVANPVIVFHSTGFDVWAPDSARVAVSFRQEGNGSMSYGRGIRFYRGDSSESVARCLQVDRAELHLRPGTQEIQLVDSSGAPLRVRIELIDSNDEVTITY